MSIGDYLKGDNNVCSTQLPVSFTFEVGTMTLNVVSWRLAQLDPIKNPWGIQENEHEKRDRASRIIDVLKSLANMASIIVLQNDFFLVTQKQDAIPNRTLTWGNILRELRDWSSLVAEDGRVILFNNKSITMLREHSLAAKQVLSFEFNQQTLRLAHIDQMGSVHRSSPSEVTEQIRKALAQTTIPGNRERTYDAVIAVGDAGEIWQYVPQRAAIAKNMQVPVNAIFAASVEGRLSQGFGFPTFAYSASRDSGYTTQQAFTTAVIDPTAGKPIDFDDLAPNFCTDDANSYRLTPALKIAQSEKERAYKVFSKETREELQNHGIAVTSAITSSGRQTFALEIDTAARKTPLWAELQALKRGFNNLFIRHGNMLLPAQIAEDNSQALIAQVRTTADY